jgi:uncharacterized protein YneF (UPF0154 family)
MSEYEVIRMLVIGISCLVGCLIGAWMATR